MGTNIFRPRSTAQALQQASSGQRVTGTIPLPHLVALQLFLANKVLWEPLLFDNIGFTRMKAALLSVGPNLLISCEK